MGFALNDAFKVLIVGDSGALGQAFVQWFKRHPHCAGVFGVSRASHGFDLEHPESLKQLGQRLKQEAPFQIVIDATGALTIDGIGPEKSLARIEHGHLTRAMAINAIGPALLLREIAPLLSNGDTLYAKLSARVGSISDNRKGGWYGYRASKAALNMLLQTAAIELQRKNPLLRVVALQPGTVRSALSEPFQNGVTSLFEPDESVHGMVHAILQLPPKAGAVFLDHAGQIIPW
jgi:NAD(P)-dependent dehydrogenase (short-subunit alcohol dehydrogenase family)